MPVAPVQSLNTYSEAGEAVIVTVVPALYSPEAGVIVPPSAGLTVVVSIYLTGTGGGVDSSSDEQEK